MIGRIAVKPELWRLVAILGIIRLQKHAIEHEDVEVDIEIQG